VTSALRTGEQTQFGNGEQPVRRLTGDQRRQQLFAVSLELFAERGYRATTMDDIAHAAGVTKPLLYQHFASKRALYLELVQHVSDELVAALCAAHGRATGPRELVENGYRAYFEMIMTHKDAFRLVFGRHALDDPELAVAVRTAERRVLELVEARIPTELGPEHRRLLAYALMGMAEAGARFWADSSRTGAATTEDIDALSLRVSSLAWAGLRAVEPD
jgi:AcrR family transcriptional regulator